MKSKRNYQIKLTGVGFLIFTAILLNNTYRYFFLNELYEGYMVIGIIMTYELLFGIIATVSFLFARDKENFYPFIGFLLLTLVTGLMGTKLTLIISPIITLYATYHFLWKINPRRK